MEINQIIEVCTKTSITECISQFTTSFGLTVAYIVLLFIVFAESGLFVGFFLPGDSLLFATGVLASKGIFNIYLLCIAYSFAAILGDSFGYAFGRKAGEKLFKKEDGRLFKKDHLLKAQAYYEKHGKMTIILARFTPIVRTFAPIVAGIGKMEYKTFIKYNIVGGILWGTGMTLAGYFLGKAFDIDTYLLPIVAVIVLISLLPTVYELVKGKLRKK